MKDKLINGVVLGAIGFIGLIMVYAILLLVIPVDTMVVFNQPVKILNFNHTVQRSDYLEVYIDYCRYSDAELEISREVIDGLIFPLQTDTATLPVGCKKVITREYISKGLPPGKYYLKYEYKFKVNPLKTEYYVFRTEDFTII